MNELCDVTEELMWQVLKKPVTAAVIKIIVIPSHLEFFRS